MSYEVLTEWSGNLVKWMYRYSILQSSVAKKAGMSYVYLCRLLHMEKPYVGSCEKVDRAMSEMLEEIGFDPSRFNEEQAELRSQLEKVV